MTDARAAEAKKEDAVVEFRGRSFTIPREYNDWSIDLLESIEEGKSVGIVRGALGQKQWAQVRAMNLKVSDLNELAELVSGALGFGSTGE